MENRAAARWNKIAPFAVTIASLLFVATATRREPDHRSVGTIVGKIGRDEGGRGRAATTPREIPAEGWKDIAWRIYGAISTHRLLSVAAGVTYYALLAIFPALASLVSLYGIFADPSTIGTQLQSFSAFLPQEGLQLLGEQIRRLTEHHGSTLGITFLAGLLASLWSASSGMKALFDALNIVYDETEKRSFLRLSVFALAFTLGAIVFMLLAFTGAIIVPIALKFVGLGAEKALVLSLIRWPLLLVVAAFALAVIYRFGPSRNKPKWRWVSWGSAIASVLWLIVSALFSWYAANFGHYDATYGTLGAAIAFLTWMWLSTVVVLLGALINAEAEHQTARDSTVGPEKPLGARHAKMADTIGAARDRPQGTKTG